MKNSLLRRFQIVQPDAPLKIGSVEWDDTGRIVAVHAAGEEPVGCNLIGDGEGVLCLWPGFIDLHTHGADGVDLSMATEEAVRTFAAAKLREGVTTFLPTTWTASAQEIQQMARAVAAYQKRMDFARAPALHVEGPYLNPLRAGAQDPAQMRHPDLNEMRALLELCPIGILSLAIELPGAHEMIRWTAEHGIRSSCAHSAASYAEFQNARAIGLNHLTHFCNQMTPLHHREVGLVGAGLLDHSVGLEIIADGIHLSTDMLRLIFRHCKSSQLMVVTDSMAASHRGDGDYPTGNSVIHVENGVARTAAGDLAGSTLKMDQALRNLLALGETTEQQMACAFSWNQAQRMGWQDRGCIRPGHLADFVVMDAEWQVKSVWIGGKQKH